MKKSIIKLCDYIIKGLMIIITTILIVVVFGNVFFRYILKIPLSWANEVAGFSFIWWVFLGTALAVKEDRHITIEYVTKRLSLKANKGRKRFIYLLLITFNAVLFYQTVKMYPILLQQKTPYTEVPMGWMYLIIPISTFIMIVYSLFWVFSSKDIEKDKDLKNDEEGNDLGVTVN